MSLFSNFLRAATDAKSHHPKCSVRISPGTPPFQQRTALRRGKPPARHHLCASGPHPTRAASPRSRTSPGTRAGCRGHTSADASRSEHLLLAGTLKLPPLWPAGVPDSERGDRPRQSPHEPTEAARARRATTGVPCDIVSALTTSAPATRLLLPLLLTAFPW